MIDILYQKVWKYSFGIFHKKCKHFETEEERRKHNGGIWVPPDKHKRAAS